MHNCIKFYYVKGQDLYIRLLKHVRLNFNVDGVSNLVPFTLQILFFVFFTIYLHVLINMFLLRLPTHLVSFNLRTFFSLRILILHWILQGKNQFWFCYYQKNYKCRVYVTLPEALRFLIREIRPSFRPPCLLYTPLSAWSFTERVVQKARVL